MYSPRIALLVMLVASLPPAVGAAPPEEAVPDTVREPAGAAGAPATAVDLQTALRWTLQSNPGLVTVRQNLCVSAEAIEVARRFPTSLNPTVTVNDLPWVFERQPGDGVQRLKNLVSVSWAQPIELGHRRDFRTSMAEASYCQTRWNVLQAELSALVQTYRLHQTATYRRERLAVTQRLVEFNQRLLESLRRQMEANQVTAADVVLAEVETQATAQQLETARQEYIASLTDLRQQVGMPQYAASIEPAGDLQVPQSDLPGGDEVLVRLALENRPEIRAATAQVANSRAALDLARADRIPVPSVGPAYERDESGTSFYGLAVSSPIPLLNTGAALVRQREAEYHRDCVALEQDRQQVTAQVHSVLAKWKQVGESAARTRARSEPIHLQAERMQRLFAAGQTDLVKLLQVRGRLIEAENAQLEAVWQTTQAYADLLAALGSTPLLGAPEPANRH